MTGIDLVCLLELLLVIFLTVLKGFGCFPSWVVPLSSYENAFLKKKEKSFGVFPGRWKANSSFQWPIYI